VKETVDVLRLDKSTKCRESRIKSVNAVLRRLSREGTELLAKTALSDTSRVFLHNGMERDLGDEATGRIIESPWKKHLGVSTLDSKASSEEREH
jgi:hypothetical protein